MTTTCDACKRKVPKVRVEGSYRLYRCPICQFVGAGRVYDDCKGVKSHITDDHQDLCEHDQRLLDVVRREKEEAS